MLDALNQLTRSLAEARSLEEIADLAACTLAATLPGRGVLCQLWSRRGDVESIEASAGGEMSSDLHVTPLRARHGIVGELVVDGGGDEDPLSDDDRAWIEALSTVLSGFVREELAAREQRSAQFATVLAIARLLERRDPSVGRHFDRMRHYCRILGSFLQRTFQLEERFIEELSCACILHDVGKIAISDAILLKPGRLTEEERAVIQTHTQIGAETLDAVLSEHGEQRILELGRDVARGHHEHWDGNGYPRGLVGDDIPVAARIVGLLDVYDALTHDRPFRKAWKHEDAVEWIEGQAGKQFDPRIVQSFLACAERLDAARRRFPDPAPEGELDLPIPG